MSSMIIYKVTHTFHTGERLEPMYKDVDTYEWYFTSKEKALSFAFKLASSKSKESYIEANKLKKKN